MTCGPETGNTALSSSGLPKRGTRRHADLFEMPYPCLRISGNRALYDITRFIQVRTNRHMNLCEEVKERTSPSRAVPPSGYRGSSKVVRVMAVSGYGP